MAQRMQQQHEEARRKAEDEAAKRMLNEQSKRVEGSVDASQVVVPDVLVPQETAEEKALARQQARTQEVMKARMEEDEQDFQAKLDRETRQEENEQRQKIQARKEQTLHERKQKLAAVVSARTDLTEDEKKKVQFDMVDSSAKLLF